MHASALDYVLQFDGSSFDRSGTADLNGPRPQTRSQLACVQRPDTTIHSASDALSSSLAGSKRPEVGTEMALHVLANNMKRVMRILGIAGLMDAIRA